MAIRYLALMALAAVAAGACVNARRRQQRMNQSGRKPESLQAWESEGGSSMSRSAGLPTETHAGMPASAGAGVLDDVPARGDDVLGTGDDRPPAAGSSALPAGRNLA